MEIEVRDVSYFYINNSSKIEALKDISFNIKKGTINGILGKSGSGKTTLLNLIYGAFIPSTGYITGNKVLTNAPKIRRNIGFVPQFNDEYFLEKTVLEELKLTSKSIKKIISALNMVGLDAEYLKRYIKSLSSGEKRLVAIASALINAPSLLLLDEPGLGLDKINKNRLINLLKKINQKHKVTIIISSHDINLLNSLATELIILKDGKVLLEGSKEEVFKKHSLLNKNNIELPSIIEFINKVYKEKDIKLGNYDDVKDLIKAVYRNV